MVREQLTIHSDFPLPAHHRLLDDLVALRGDMERRLMLPPSDEPIHVYLFESEERFKGFMRLHHPDFPARRAFFLETDTRLEVYAQWGDRVAEDLRHEVTHAYLHSAVPNLPVWLDEGLAKYYEAPRGQGGLNRQMFEAASKRLQKPDGNPSLPQLERISPIEQLSLDDYAESWAWAHLMLEDRPEYREILCRYLADLRRGYIASPLSMRLSETVAQPEAALREHLRKSGERESMAASGRPLVK